jgi:hypothetical protein
LPLTIIRTLLLPHSSADKVHCCPTTDPIISTAVDRLYKQLRRFLLFKNAMVPRVRMHGRPCHCGHPCCLKALRCAALHCTAQHTHSTAQRCAALHSTLIARHSTALRCTAQHTHSTAQHCTAGMRMACWLPPAAKYLLCSLAHGAHALEAGDCQRSVLRSNHPAGSDGYTKKAPPFFRCFREWSDLPCETKLISAIK